MFLIKILLWLSSFTVVFIIFSLNTLISIFCFILIIFFISFFLIQLHVEYLTYLILLLYLGGILIFFLFTALMLNNEYVSIKTSVTLSIDNICSMLFFFKCFFLLTFLNYKLSRMVNFHPKIYLPTFMENSYFYKDLINNQGDALGIVSLYTEKAILLLILGIILLFAMIGIIVITRNTNA